MAQTIAGIRQLGTTIISLAAAFVSTAVARANVTGMSFNVVAGKIYRVTLIGSYQTGTLTTGGSIGFVLTSGAGTIIGNAAMAIALNATTAPADTTINGISASNTLANSFIVSSAVGVINSPHYLNADLIFTCTTSGVFQLQFASEVALSGAQLNTNTKLIVEQLN